METIILIGSIIGIVNSFILVTYALVSKKGNRKSNLIFAFFILMLTLRISKSILLTFSDGLHDFLLTIGLSGFLAIGPSFYFFTKSVINLKFKFKWKQMIHLLPAIVFTFMWVLLDSIRNEADTWHIFYRTILLQYMLYLTFSIHKINYGTIENENVKKQLNLIGIFLMAIWFAYLLNEVSGFPYISGAILYSVLIYFSLIIIINKGYIINMANPKYLKTGLKSDENERIYRELKKLMDENAAYKDNTISLAKLAKQINTSTHALSQVINENFKKSFFELVGQYRIAEAKKLLREEREIKVSDIAFDVGYNSLSAFNSAFKKSTGITPTKFRNE
ncbi:helix-turn-helix domain-containing protein [uncultured Draconibacterium sp.]|uniref:helix-turn-helix domain-containing protein n=1 Tax=uncultured Draconibacterium sp. TaxID=1573823 RepID=UPI002AA8DC64|nr:helix-turn-helix domain-containing protein [uncultured Draconibacterium sp.]